MVSIAELRKQRNITQADLASAIGVTASAVANWETGLRAPRLSVARKVATYFGVSVDSLFFLRDEATIRDRCDVKKEGA